MSRLRSTGFLLICCLPLATACNFERVDPSELGGADSGSGTGSGGGGGGGGTVEHVLFPIADGDKHSSIECTGCHSDLATPTDPATITCAGCHTGTHEEQKELERHSKGPGVGEHYAWDSQACLTCHPVAAVTRRSEHETETSHLGEHGGESCTDCHPARSDLTPSTYQSFQCTPCHEGIPGRVTAPTPPPAAHWFDVIEPDPGLDRI